MPRMRNEVYIWVTWLTRLLVGDASCEWASWFRSRYVGYDRAPSDFNLTRWKMDHTKQLNELRGELEAANFKVTVENENWFRTRGASGAVIAGKPDIIAADAEGNVTVYDVKTGAERASDGAQMMIYMYALPLAVEGRWNGRVINGCLVYGNGRRNQIPADAIDEDFRDNLFALLRRVAAAIPARRVPSVQECSWCDLTSTDCPERIEKEVA